MLIQLQVQDGFPRVSKGCMAEIVAQRDRPHEVLVEAQGVRHCSRESCATSRDMREPRTAHLTLGCPEHIVSCLEPAEALGVNDAVATFWTGDRTPSSLSGNTRPLLAMPKAAP